MTSKTCLSQFSWAIFFSFLSVASLFLFYSITGLDLTDQGYLLGNDEGYKEPLFLTIWGSIALINGLQAVFGDWAYFYSKLLANYSVFPILFYYISTFKTRNHSSTYISILILSCLWSMRAPLSEWLYYSTISGFVISLVLLLLDDSLKKENFLKLYIATILIFISALIKITNLVFLVLPLIYLYFYTRKKRNLLNHNLIKALIAILVTLGVSAILIYATEASNYVSKGIILFKQFLGNTKVHSKSTLLNKNWTELRDYFHSTIVFLIYTVALLATGFIRSSKMRILFEIAVSFLFIVIQHQSKLYYYNGLFPFYVAVLIYIILSRDEEFQFLASITLFFLIFNSIGSGNGLRASFIAEPLTCFLILSYLFKHFENRIQLLIIAVCSLCIISIVNKIKMPYRDLDRTTLFTFSSLKKIKGVTSHKEKINTIENLYADLNKTIPNAKTALIYPSAPLLHYIFSLKSYTPNPWINLYFPDQLENFFESNRKLPDVVVKLFQNPRMKDWPLNLRSLDKDLNRESIQTIDRFVKENNFLSKVKTSRYEILIKR